MSIRTLFFSPASTCNDQACECPQNACSNLATSTEDVYACDTSVGSKDGTNRYLSGRYRFIKINGESISDYNTYNKPRKFRFKDENCDSTTGICEPSQTCGECQTGWGPVGTCDKFCDASTCDTTGGDCVSGQGACTCKTGYVTDPNHATTGKKECTECASGYMKVGNQCVRYYTQSSQINQAERAAAVSGCGEQEGLLCAARGQCYKHSTGDYKCKCAEGGNNLNSATCTCPAYFGGPKCKTRCEKRHCTGSSDPWPNTTVTHTGCSETCISGESGCSACGGGTCVTQCNTDSTTGAWTCAGTCKCNLESGLVPSGQGFSDQGAYFHASKHGDSCQHSCYSGAVLFQTLPGVDWEHHLTGTHALKWLTDNSASNGVMSYCASAGGYCSNAKGSDGGCKCSAAFEYATSHYLGQHGAKGQHNQGLTLKVGAHAGKVISPACNIPAGAYTATNNDIAPAGSAYADRQCNSPFGDVLDFTPNQNPEVCGSWSAMPIGHDVYGMKVITGVGGTKSCACFKRRAFFDEEVAQTDSTACCPAGHTMRASASGKFCTCRKDLAGNSMSHIQRLLQYEVTGADHANLDYYNVDSGSGWKTPYSYWWAKDVFGPGHSLFDEQASIKLRRNGATHVDYHNFEFGKTADTLGVEWPNRALAKDDHIAVLEVSPGFSNAFNFDSIGALKSQYPNSHVETLSANVNSGIKDIDDAGLHSMLTEGKHYRVIYIPDDTIALGFYIEVATIILKRPGSHCEYTNPAGIQPANSNGCVSSYWYSQSTTCSVTKPDHTCTDMKCEANGQFTLPVCSTGAPTNAPTPAPTATVTNRVSIQGVTAVQMQQPAAQQAFSAAVANTIGGGTTASQVTITSITNSNGAVTPMANAVITLGAVFSGTPAQWTADPTHLQTVRSAIIVATSADPATVGPATVAVKTSRRLLSATVTVSVDMTLGHQPGFAARADVYKASLTTAMSSGGAFATSLGGSLPGNLTKQLPLPLSPQLPPRPTPRRLLAHQRPLLQAPHPRGQLTRWR